MIENADHIILHEPGFVQRREWMLYKIREDHYPFNTHMSFELDTFDAPFFQKVIDFMLERHEILRTTLQVIEGRLVQVIHNPKNFKVGFSLFDLTQKNEDDKTQYIKTKKIVQFALPFNLELGPLFRILVFQKEENRFEVVCIFHHVIFDNHSAEIFRRDAFHIWDMLLKTTPEPLYNPDFQYKNYSSLENQLLDTSRGDEYRSFWKLQLKNDLPRLLIIDSDKWNHYVNDHLKRVNEVRNRIRQLPYCDERLIASVIRRYKPGNAGNLKYVFENSTFQQISEYRNKRKNSLLSVFISTLLLSLQKMSAQDTFVVELPASRKTEGHFNNTIGWLMAGGVCYFDLNEVTDTASLLNYVDEKLYQLSMHCIYPLETLSYLEKVPVGSRIPLFMTLLDLNDEDEIDTGKKGIVNHIYEASECYQDLTLYVYLLRNSCNLEVEYNNQLLPSDTVETLSAELELFAKEILNNMLFPENRSGLVPMQAGNHN